MDPPSTLDAVDLTLRQTLKAQAKPIRRPPPAQDFQIEGLSIPLHDLRGVHAVLGSEMERHIFLRQVSNQSLSHTDISLHFEGNVCYEVLNNLVQQLEGSSTPMPRTLFIIINQINALHEETLALVQRLCAVSRRASVSFWIGIDNDYGRTEQKRLISRFFTADHSRYQFVLGRLVYHSRPGEDLRKTE